MRENSLDMCLDLVADRQRRRIIRQLRDDPGRVMTVDDLVDRVRSIGGLSASDRHPDRDRLAIELVHTHLPKLTSHGVVEFDPKTGSVRYQPDEQVEAVLDSLPGEVAQPSL